MKMRGWRCKACGHEFLADASPLPRVVPCPKCGDAVLLTKDRTPTNDSNSFWLGFFFGWLGVIGAGLSKGTSGVNHALGGYLVQWLVGAALMLILGTLAIVYALTCL